MNNRTTSILMALSLLAWAAPAAAQDFTFTVPVELHSVEASRGGFRVLCKLQINGQEVGYGSNMTQLIPFDSDGNYLLTEGPVTVTITLPSDMDDAAKLAVNSYECTLVWELGGAQADQARPDTPVTVLVAGPIVQGG